VSVALTDASTTSAIRIERGAGTHRPTRFRPARRRRRRPADFRTSLVKVLGVFLGILTAIGGLPTWVIWWPTW
jgi:hypothetical protein